MRFQYMGSIVLIGFIFQQAASGVPEDGIMTADLLEKLYMEIRIKNAGGVDEKENYSTVLPKVTIMLRFQKALQLICALTRK